MAQIMTTKEVAKYLKLHHITVCKLSKEGKIPSIRIGRVWRFDKEIIDAWLRGEQSQDFFSIPQSRGEPGSGGS